MTVSTATASASYTGNGATQIFPVPFYFLADTDIKVSHRVAATGVISTLVLNSDYTLTGAGNQAGGSATLVAAPASGDELFIERNVSAVQETAYPTNGPFPSASHEKALDRLTMLVQQILSKLTFGLFRDPLTATYDAGGNTISNVANAVNAQDVPSLVQVQGLITGGAAPALASSNGAALVGFIQAGTGAVAETVQDALRESLSVKRYGAKGDGSTDDTAAVQAAINACAQLGVRRCYVPSGTYRLTAKLSVPTGGVDFCGDGYGAILGSTGDGVNVRGSGSWLWFDHIDAGIEHTLAAQGVLRLENLGLVRTQTAPATSFTPIETGYDIDFSGNDLFLTNVCLLNPTYGIYNRAGGRIWTCRVIGQPLKVGVRVDASTDTNRFQDIHFWPYWSNQDGVRTYQRLNLDAFLIYRMDNSVIDRCFAIGAARFVHLAFSAAGTASKLRITNCDGDLGSYFLAIDSSVSGATVDVSDCVTQGTTSDFLASFHNIVMAGDNCTLRLSNVTLSTAQASNLRVNGSNNTVFMSNVVLYKWNQGGGTFAGVSVGTSTNKIYYDDTTQSTWASPTSAVFSIASGSSTSGWQFAGYFSSDGTTTKRLPNGWTLSRVGTGNYSLTHNLGLVAQDDIIFDLTCDTTANGAFAQIDRTNSSVNGVRIRVFVGTTATDSGVYFTTRMVRP